MNGTHLLVLCFNPIAKKVSLTLVYCGIFVFSLAGNSSIAIIVFKSRAMRKPINFLIVNMAMSDLLYAIFVVPPNLVGVYAETWLVVGLFGEVSRVLDLRFCLCVSSELGSYSSGSIWSCGISSSTSTHDFKVVLFLYCYYLDHLTRYLLPLFSWEPPGYESSWQTHLCDSF